jgi:hypothetical protein
MRILFDFKKYPIISGCVLVAHACNPSYLGGRDQEDGGLRPAWSNSSQDTILKTPNTKKNWQSGSSGRAPA